MDDTIPTNPLRDFLSNKRNIMIIGGVVLVIVLYFIYIGISRQLQAPTGQMMSNENNVPGTQVQYEEAPTPTYSPEVAAAVQEQQEADQEYQNFQQNVRKEYPWKKHLPLQTDKHYLMFDISRRVFIGQLYPTATDGVEQMKKDILEEMKSKDIPTEEYPIEWTVNPR